jgi:hypothetical protein
MRLYDRDQMQTVLGGSVTLALLGRGSFGVVFLAGGLVAIALGVVLRDTSWFVAAIAIPGAAAGLVGAVVWATGDLSLRWLLIFAPLAAATVFVSRREGTAQAAAAALTSAVVAVAFFLLGAGVAFLSGYSD